MDLYMSIVSATILTILAIGLFVFFIAAFFYVFKDLLSELAERREWKRIEKEQKRLRKKEKEKEASNNASTL